jgi:hypothetical protein
VSTGWAVQATARDAHDPSLICKKLSLINLHTMVVPGYVAEVRTRFTRPGIYQMPCNEFCGKLMRPVNIASLRRGDQISDRECRLSA